MGEAILLTIAMSLDGFAAGVGYSMNDVSVGAVITAFFLASLISIRLGYFLGWRTAKEKDYSWIGGVLLVFSRILRNFSGNINEVGCLAASAAALQSSDNWYRSGVAPQTSAESG